MEGIIFLAGFILLDGGFLNTESLGFYTDVLWLVTCHIARLGLSSNISSMRRGVSSPDETLRGELKIQRATEYF